ncbi:MAG: sugar ABC transporter permease [Spirochaetales bacterium]|nr:sugar ABC transporter permease [Spirochaetales bacterium]
MFKLNYKISSQLFYWLLIIPSVVFLFVMVSYPLIYGVSLSLSSWNMLRPDLPRKYVGFKNYISLFRDKDLLKSILITLYFGSMSISLEMFLGFGIALLLQKKIKGFSVFRSLILIPLMVAPVVTGFIWNLILNPEFGSIPTFFSFLGIKFLKNFPVLANVKMVIPTIVIIDAWTSTPFVVLVLLAGLQSLPISPYEASMIDGANGFQQLIYITIPLLKPFILVALLIRTINVIRYFDVIFVLTGGGPGTASEVLALYNYRISFINYEMGYGSAVAFFILVLTISISTIFIKILRKTK